MNTRSRLSILTPEDINRFKPNVVLCEEAKKQRGQARECFFSTLIGIAAAHPGEQLLAIRRRQIKSFETEIIQAHLYLGLISDRVPGVCSSSDGSLFPTIRYVDSPKTLHPISRSEGNIPENTFGINAIWPFFLKLPDDQYALDIFVGDEEVKEWFSHPNRIGRYPYVHQDLLRALHRSSPLGVHRPIQFAPA